MKPQVQQILVEKHDGDVQETKVEISKQSWQKIIGERNKKAEKVGSSGFNLFGEDDEFNLFEEPKQEAKVSKISDEKYVQLKEKRQQK